MRIVGGEFKGKRLATPKGLEIRPTSDYLRESIFNILSDIVEGAVVLDLFAGTGALGLEALSRGASYAVFVDIDPQALNLISSNIELCQAQSHSRVAKLDILRGLDHIKSKVETIAPFDIIFLDPPYNKGFVEPTLKMLAQYRNINDQALIIVEHSTAEVAPPNLGIVPQAEPKRLRLVDQRRKGSTFISFWEYCLHEVEKEYEVQADEERKDCNLPGVV